MEDMRKRLMTDNAAELVPARPKDRVASLQRVPDHSKKQERYQSPASVITTSSTDSTPTHEPAKSKVLDVNDSGSDSDKDVVVRSKQSTSKPGARPQVKRLVIDSDEEGDFVPSFPVPHPAPAPASSTYPAPNDAPTFPVPQPAQAPKGIVQTVKNVFHDVREYAHDVREDLRLNREKERIAATVRPGEVTMPQPFRPSNGNIHNNYPKVIANTTIPGGFTKPSTVINAPTNPPYTKPKPTDGNPLWETFDEPADLGLYDPRKSAADAEKDLKDLLQDSMNDVAFEGVDMSLAHVQGFREGITLMPHQIVGRVWMKDRETGKKNGGILADDMGLGKTIQTLVRISDGRPRKSDKDSGFAAATLVVCPVALVSQWASEIKKMVVGMRVIEHHGPSRTWDPQELSRAHIVVTSYSIVGSEYASYSGDAKDKSKPKASSKASTSKSKSTGNSSESEFEAGSDDDSDSDRETFGRTLAKHKKAAPKSKKKALDALFRVKWWRIVLDEAHNIKNRKTKTAIACVALEGKFRWCLTGTPMQNNVEELFSLLQFLRIRPLNDWETFNHQINKPVKSGRSVRAMKRLQLVLKAIMLRRKKDTLLNGKPLIELPPRIVNVQPCEFDEDEREFYDALEKKIALTINKFMKGGAQMPNYTSMLVLLLRLRQACNHPSLVSKDFSTDKEAVEPKAAKNDGDLDGADDLADLFGQMGVAGERKCQMCQEILSEEEAHNPDATHCAGCADIAAKSRRRSLARPGIDLPPDSAKIRMILQLLEDIDERSDGEEKTIIFSQFTSMLDLLQPFLRANGVRYVRYDGSMRKDQREASLETIRTSGSVKCILISFKAGSTGLNLTACNNVILVDLWWNPALEDQAFDRTHRFGQTRQVNIFKLTIPNTVEERILKLQEDKRALANAALSGDKLTKSKNLGINDLMALFKGHGGGDDDEE